MYVCVHIHIYIYIYIYTHTYILILIIIIIINYYVMFIGNLSSDTLASLHANTFDVFWGGCYYSIYE